MEYHFVILVAAALCAPVLSQSVPTYIEICDAKSSDYNKCALEKGNAAIPHIVKGDRRLGIPPLNPLKLPLVDVTQDNLKFSLKDVEVHGLESAHLKSIDFDKSHLNIVLHMDKLEILGTYTIDGRILLLDLKGQGPANITAVGGDYEVKATLEPYTKGGETLLKFSKPDFDLKLERAYFNLQNLLGDRDELSSEINQVLNENWEDVLNNLGAPIKETVSTIIESIVSKILDKVPAKSIFPD